MSHFNDTRMPLRSRNKHDETVAYLRSVQATSELHRRLEFLLHRNALWRHLKQAH
jgi:hypothetical protein